MLLEDKCKWGESFIFVYDVTDRYSFDELTRLKFIASYTHSRLRVNFTPCWVLVGNKADLADRERMVSVEEGQGLARDLGCHIFREISAKESMIESSLVFEDLWREFLRMSPRSPSSSQRRKFSIRIQDKISILDSHSCSCNLEMNRQNLISASSTNNSSKRQANTFQTTRQTKEEFVNDPNNNEEMAETARNCPCIPEHKEDEEEQDVTNISEDRQRRSFAHLRSRRSAIVPLFNRRKTLNKSISFDNVFSNVVPTSPTETTNGMTSSSRSSSSSSLNASSPGLPPPGAKAKTFDRLRLADSANPTDDVETQYREQYCRNRQRRWGSVKITALIPPQET